MYAVVVFWTVMVDPEDSSMLRDQPKDGEDDEDDHHNDHNLDYDEDDGCSYECDTESDRSYKSSQRSSSGSYVHGSPSLPTDASEKPSKTAFFVPLQEDFSVVQPSKR